MTTKEILEKYKDASLNDVLTHLISEQDGVPPEKVTVEYIREQREKRIYRTARYNIGSDYGGYGTEGLQFLTHEELDAIEQRSVAMMKEIFGSTF